MPSVFLTAFEPYDRWATNSSSLALDELLRDPPASLAITSRVWPVEFDMAKAELRKELAYNYDYVLHLGQAPGTSKVQFEAVGLNIACDRQSKRARPLCDDGPLAYRSALAIDDWADRVRSAGISAEVSFHAGTYLCNAALYLTHYFIERMGLKTQAGFIHLPLDPSQLIDEPAGTPSLPAGRSVAAIRIALESLG